MFTTDSGVIYEVRFGRKQNNILHSSIVFGVLNEEIQEDEGEYPVVNRGELYSVMATITEVIHMYMAQHPRTTTYEFAGENKKEEGEGSDVVTVRTKFFFRYMDRIFGKGWKAEMKGNTVTIDKIYSK